MTEAKKIKFGIAGRFHVLSLVIGLYSQTVKTAKRITETMNSMSTFQHNIKANPFDGKATHEIVRYSAEGAFLLVISTELEQQEKYGSEQDEPAYLSGVSEAEWDRAIEQVMKEQE